MPRARQFDEQEILQKAMNLFWERGYHETSIKDLIEHLGINNASIYNAFGGKKQLFYRAFDHYRSIQAQGLKGFLSTQENIRKGLGLVFQKIITDDCLDETCKGCLIVTTSTELIPMDPHLQSLIKEHKHTMEEIFVDFLKKGVDTGQVSREIDIAMISRLLYTLMMGLRVLGKTKPNPEESLASAQAVISLLDK